MDTSNLIICTDASPDFQGIFDFSIAPSLLYYSYLPIIFISLLLGTFVLFKNKFSLISKILFLITSFFSIFIANELLQWVAVPAGIMYFAWALSLLLHFFIVLLTFYFVYLFINKNDFSFSQKVLFMLVSLPVILLLPTNLNIPSFDVDWCGAITGPLWYYLYAFEVVTATFLLAWGIKLIKNYYRFRDRALLPSIYLLFGASFFLFVFFGSYFVSEIADLYQINLYEFNFTGPIGMLIFIGVLSYMIVKFKTFNIKLLGAQVLVVALIVLVGSQYFFVNNTTGYILTGVTLAMTLGFGYFLVRGVLREAKQLEEISKLAGNLENANKRLLVLDKMKSEFVSIASHQLRSPLTSIRGYASMLAEGSYGKLPEKAQEAASNIAESSKYMAMSIEDYLNVSRIEAGNMKYELSDFNLRDIAEKVVDEMRPTAIKKGLVMMFRTECSGSTMIHADIGKTRQVLMNLIDNSMKYTPKGTITVVAHDHVDNKKMFVSIHDTGVGMSEETKGEIFDKFVRAKNANNINVTGTGLGLYIARKMVNEMGGKVYAESEGEGKGSTFKVEFHMLEGKGGR